MTDHIYVDKPSNKSELEIVVFNIESKKKGFDVKDYDVFSNNCIHYAEKLVDFLINEPIPGKFKRTIIASAIHGTYMKPISFLSGKSGSRS